MGVTDMSPPDPSLTRSPSPSAFFANSSPQAGPSRLPHQFLQAEEEGNDLMGEEYMMLDDAESGHDYEDYYDVDVDRALHDLRSMEAQVAPEDYQERLNAADIELLQQLQNDMSAAADFRPIFGSVIPPDDHPLFADRFLHYDLLPADRMAYTQAAFSSISGSHLNSVSSVLNFAAAYHHQTTGRRLTDDTMDPFEAYRRLGVDPDSVIQRFAVCSNSDCCLLHAANDLRSFDSSISHLDANGTNCNGEMYTRQGNSRRPCKILAFTPPSTMLRCFLRDPTFERETQSWRDSRAGDDIVPMAPSSEPVVGPNEPMNSVFDGSMWRSRDAEMVRMVASSGEVKDFQEGRSRRLVSLEFGLLGVLNLDW